jgi:hypothetical protein
MTEDSACDCCKKVAEYLTNFNGVMSCPTCYDLKMQDYLRNDPNAGCPPNEDDYFAGGD